MATDVGLSVPRRRVLSRRIRFFVAATITYNVVEAVVAISAGAAASSIALLGFGLDSVVEVGALKIDPATRRVTRGAENGEAREVKLGATEFRLLHFFMTHPERVHSRAQLLDRVWGDHVFIEERTVDVHVKRLREALNPVQCAQMIETVRGAGYRLTQHVAAPAVSA